MSEITEHYLDNAATTMPYPEVVEVIADALTSTFGNPSSAHARGKQAKRLLTESRRTIAELLGVEPEEIRFTSGGTESNNLAIAGACRVRPELLGIITSDLEHASVTKSVRGLRNEGWKPEYVPAPGGVFDLEAYRGFLGPTVSLVTLMSVQNEIGARYPIAEAVRFCRELAPQALFHTDAVQAFGKIDFRPGELGVDLASMSGHKIGGPKGIGALYVRKETKLFTTAFGGGQEYGLRSGTEAVPLIAGFAKAAEITLSKRARIFENAQACKERLLAWVSERHPDTRVNSPADGSPYIVSLSFPGMSNTKALARLSDAGVYVSKASACTNNHTTVRGPWRPKHEISLLLAGIPNELVNSTLRISFGASTTTADVDALCASLDAFLAEQGEKGEKAKA